MISYTQSDGLFAMTAKPYLRFDLVLNYEHFARLDV